MCLIHLIYIYPCGGQYSDMSCPGSISLHVAEHCLRSQCPTLTLYTRHSFPPSCSKLQVLLRMEFYYENWCLESAGSQCQEVDKTCYWVSSFIEPLDSLKDCKLIHILLSTLSHIRSRLSQQTPSWPPYYGPYWIEIAETPSRNIFAKHHPSKTSFQHSHVVLLHATCCPSRATIRSSLLALLLFHCEVHSRPSKHKQCRSTHAERI